MTETEERALVVAEVRKWLLTPYHSCADIFGVGVDCGMLIIRAFVDTGLVPPFDPRPYPHDWHLHRSDEKYLGFVKQNCVRVDRAQPGDVMVFRYGRCYSHGGVVTSSDPLTIVHAFADAGFVLEEVVEQNSRLRDPDRHPLFFSKWGA